MGPLNLRPMEKDETGKDQNETGQFNLQQTAHIIETSSHTSNTISFDFEFGPTTCAVFPMATEKVYHQEKMPLQAYNFRSVENAMEPIIQSIEMYRC